MWLIGDILVGSLGSVRSCEILVPTRSSGSIQIKINRCPRVRSRGLGYATAEIGGGEVIPFNAEILELALNITPVHDGSSRTSVVFVPCAPRSRPKATTLHN
jgi:hypothetical protein